MVRKREKSKMKSPIKLLLAALLALAAGTAAHALAPTASASYKVSYSTANGGPALLTGTTIQARCNLAGQDNTRLQSSQLLPVAFSQFGID
jgi:hypothetical protein